MCSCTPSGGVAESGGRAVRLALQAQAAALTIDTVVTAPGYVLPAADTLVITAAGELNSPTTIALNGWLDNAGILRADMLTLGAVRVDNRAGARIAARALFSRANIFNAAGGTWVTGAAPSMVPPLSAGGYFATGNSAYFSNFGEWLSHGDVSFQSSFPSFYNNGIFASQNVGASPYLQTMTGGILNGNGTINGDVFIEGSGPPVAPYTNCLSPAPGSPCFKPGNSPGPHGDHR